MEEEEITRVIDMLLSEDEENHHIAMESIKSMYKHKIADKSELAYIAYHLSDKTANKYLINYKTIGEIIGNERFGNLYGLMLDSKHDHIRKTALDGLDAQMKYILEIHGADDKLKVHLHEL